MTCGESRASRPGAADFTDLRSALALLASVPEHRVSTRDPVDPVAELAAACKPVGAGTPVAPPPGSGPR